MTKQQAIDAMEAAAGGLLEAWFLSRGDEEQWPILHVADSGEYVASAGPNGWDFYAEAQAAHLKAAAAAAERWRVLGSPVFRRGD